MQELKRKQGKEITKTISYRLLFINCAKFIGNTLSNLNLAEAIRKSNIIMKMVVKNLKLVDSNTNIVNTT